MALDGGGALAGPASINDVTRWEVTSSVEVSKTVKTDELTESWTLKSQGTARIASLAPAGSVHVQWGGPQYRPDGAVAYDGTGTATATYRLTVPQRGATEPGWEDRCSFSGPVPYTAMLFGYPGQPVMGGAKPALAVDSTCVRKGQSMAGEPHFSPSDIPASCEGAMPVVKGTTVTLSATCEENGFTIKYRFEAKPAGAGGR
ncbi:MAG: hypothetical protein HQK87_11600 [Nitrospinae bacterium]|nr:hypothetical protein [Nitrospinota bacterium]